MDSVGGDSIGATGIDSESEEYLTDECDSCKQDGKVRKADVSCTTCEENLCNRCLEWHKKRKASKTHDVQPISSGNDGAATTKKSDDTMILFATLCTCNQKCDVSLFCKEHKELICSTCASVKHKSCIISSIDKICRDESVMKTFNLTCEKIDDLAIKAYEMKSCKESCLNDLQEIEARCKTEICNCKTDMINGIEKLETNALLDLQTRLEYQNELIKTTGTSLEDALSLLNVDQKLLANAKISQDKRQMFIGNIQIEKSLHHYEAALSEAERKLYVPDIDFARNTRLEAILQETEHIGQVKIRDAGCKGGPEKETLLNIQATYISSAEIEQPGDPVAPIISGTAFLPNGELLIADRLNSRLTLLDTTFKVKYSTKCIGQPWDIAINSDEEVVVTLPGCQTLQFYHVSSKLQAVRSIKLDDSNYFWSVTAANDCLYASCKKPEILVLSTYGSRPRSINPAHVGISCQELTYIVLNHTGSRIYISDCPGHQLICMSTDGQHIFTFKNPDLRSPRGLIVDDDDNVLIACEGTNNVLVVRADGTKHSVLLTFGDGIFKPLGMAYNSNTRTLVLGEWGGEKLKIFKLKRP